MSKNEYLLAIESSCDDSCISVLSTDFEIILEKKVDQTSQHGIYGGVVPELASRCHVEHLQTIIWELKQNLDPQKLKCVAATIAPGLIGGLLVGTMIAKGIAHMNKIPFIGIHHLEGHIESVNIGKKNQLEYPFLTLLISGGHCQFILSEQFGNYQTLGSTLDDSVGEALDKIGKTLGLSYPAGPKIEELASQYYEKKLLDIGSPMRDQSLNFSLSGFKTSVARFIEKNHSHLLDPLFIRSVCHSVQEKIADNLHYKVQTALKFMACNYSNIQNFVLCGGVAANRLISSKIASLCLKNNINFHVPQLQYATDNATMIGWAALKRYHRNLFTNLSAPPQSRLFL